MHILCIDCELKYIGEIQERIGVRNFFNVLDTNSTTALSIERKGETKRYRNWELGWQGKEEQFPPGFLGVQEVIQTDN